MLTAPHLFILAGVCSINHQGLDFILSQPRLGQIVVIVVGGARESLCAIPGEHNLILQKHKGFVYLALRYG